MSTGSINVVLNLDSSGLTGGIATAQQSLNGLNLNINNTVRNSGHASRGFSGIASSLHGLIINAALAGEAIRNINAVTTGVMYSIAKANGEIERMTALMKGMSTATTEAAKTQEALKDTNFVFEMAKNAPVALSGLTDAFVKLKTTGIDPTKGALQTLVDANAHFGGTEDSLKRASIAISQMSSKGKVSMEELRQQLAEAIPNASQLMARGMGISMEQLIKSVSTGTVSSKKALLLMFEEMQIEFAGSAESMMKTWVGLTSQLETQWTLFQKQIGDAGFFNEAKSALEDLVKSLKTEEMAAFAASFGHTLASVVKSIVDLTKWVAANRDQIVSWLKVAAETYAVFKTWSILAAVGGYISAIFNAMVAAASGAVLLETALAPLVIGIGAISLPLTIVAGLLVAGEIAWMNWGKSAEDSLSGVSQAVKDGVKISEDGLAAIKQAQENAKEAKATKAEIAQGGLSGQWAKTKDRLRHGYTGDTLDDLMSAGKQADNSVVAERDRNSFQAATDFKIALTEKAAGVSKSANLEAAAALHALSEERTAAGIKDLANDQGYKDKSLQIHTDRNKAIIDGYDNLAKESKPTLDKFNKELNNSLFTIDPQKKKDLSNDMLTVVSKEKDSFEARQKELADRSDLYSPNTKGKDAADKKAQAELARQENALSTLKAQVAKKQAEINQPHSSENSKGEIGPYQAKYQSLIDDNPKKYGALSDEIIKLAKTFDDLNVKQKDTEKAWVSLDGTERAAVKGASRAATDLKNAQDVLANGGYTVISKTTLRMTEAMDATNEKLNEYKGTLSGPEFEAFAAKLRAITKNTVELGQETDLTNRESASLLKAKNINASLIGNTRDRANAEYAIQRDAAMSELRLTEETLRDKSGKYANSIALIEAMDAQHARQIENPLQSMARSWNDMGENIRQASTGWMSSFADEMFKMTEGGKADFRSMTVSILKDLARIMIQKAVVGLATAAFGGGGSAFQGNGPLMSYQNSSLFASGGVMTSLGKLPLNSYASGGIAKTPQVSIFGEGRQNEAYVPLPDGKTIPVTMKSKGNAGDNNVSISINVANDGEGKKDQQGGAGGGDMWGKMADNIKGIVVQTINEQKRPGGQLWAG